MASNTHTLVIDTQMVLKNLIFFEKNKQTNMILNQHLLIHPKLISSNYYRVFVTALVMYTRNL